MPDMAMLAKRRVVMPPRTGAGMPGEERSNLAKDSKEQQPASAADAGEAGGNAGQGDNAVVLGKGCVGHGEGQGGEEGVDRVAEEAPLRTTDQSRGGTRKSGLREGVSERKRRPPQLKSCCCCCC